MTKLVSPCLASMGGNAQAASGVRDSQPKRVAVVLLMSEVEVKR